MNYQHTDMCTCGHRYGLHNIYDYKCPCFASPGVVSGFSSTRTFVIVANNPIINTTPLSENWFMAPDFYTWPNCAACGKKVGLHCGNTTKEWNAGACPSGNSDSFYISGQYYTDPRSSAPLSVPLPTHSTGIPANFKKAYDPNEECPCGIGLMRSQCNYHREIK
jgi:hypothetical protein